MTTPQIKRMFAATGSLWLAGAAVAQTAPVLAPVLSDEALVLSPFEVRAETDTGYLAGTVQSGTRLRMELKDTAASISVVTKDFMRDLGANNLEDLLVYTLGTEVGGASGNFSDAGVIENPGGSEIDYDNAFGSAMPSTRVRGLTAADVARDFFVSSIPPDGYNVDRKEISRGANAMLFGLGSPAGIINASLVRADFQRRRTSLGIQLDKYGSYRGEIDHNQPLIKNKLAVRVASLYENNRYRIEEAWEEDRRGYITAAWRPFKTTTIRANFEAAKIESNRPDARPPGDAYTHWWHLGKPVYNMQTGASTLLGTPAPGWPSVFQPNNPSAFTGNAISGQIGAAGNGQFQMYLIYNDPSSSRMNIGIPGVNAGAMRGGNVANVALNAAGTALVTQGPRGLREMNAIYNRLIYVDDPTANYWKATQITDPAIYDFYTHMLHGQDKFEWAEWNTYNASIEQLLLDGKAGIELSANREKLDNGSVMPLDSTISGYTLRIDINTHLYNGLPNPNFGRPFTDAYSKLVVKSFDRDTLRATGFYDIDLRRTGRDWLGRALGRHRLQADHTRMVYTSLVEPGNFFFNNGPDYWRAVRNSAPNTRPSTASTASRGAVMFRYLGPNVSGSPTPATGAVVTPVSQWPANITSVPTYFYQSPTSTAPAGLGQWEVRDFELVSGTPKDSGPVRRNVSYTREKVNSSVAIAQGYWLEGKLVSTVGVRRDHVQTYNAGTVLPQDDYYAASLLDDRYFPKAVTNTTVDTVNWGIVGHAPERIRRRLPFGSDISLFYNVADNFRPAGQRYDIFDNAIPHETGETKDYGVVLSTLEGKLRLRIAKYETTSGMSSSLPGSNLTVPLNNLSGLIDTVQTEVLRGRNEGREAGVAAWNNWYNSPTGQALRNTFRVQEIPALPGADPATADVDSQRRSGEVVAPSDVKSTGEEYELHFKPTRGWDLTVNVAKAQAVRSNVATALRKVVFEELKPLMDGPAGQLRGTTDPLNVTQTAALTFTGQVYNQMLPRLSEEGLPTTELRKWHWNAVTNYRFMEGRLKGFNIGGAVRWQDKIAIGAPIINHPLFGFAPDVRNPHYGPTETNFDAWVGFRRKFHHFDWRIQLNVRNIGVGKELIPVGAQPDGSIAGWRVAPEETWRLTNTFSF